MAASQEELAQAEEVGDKIAGSIREYFADPVNLRIVERLRPPACNSQPTKSSGSPIRWQGCISLFPARSAVTAGMS